MSITCATAKSAQHAPSGGFAGFFFDDWDAVRPIFLERVLQKASAMFRLRFSNGS